MLAKAAASRLVRRVPAGLPRTSPRACCRLLPARRRRGRGRPRRGRRVRRARLPAKLAQTRPQGTARVRVFTPTVPEHGWSAGGHTVVEVVTDDMPFLVDSVTMALTDRGGGSTTRSTWSSTRCSRRSATWPASCARCSPTRARAHRRRREHRPGRRRRSRDRPGVLDAHRDRPGDRRGGAGRDREQAAAGAPRHPGGGRGLAADGDQAARHRRRARGATRRTCRSPTSSPRARRSCAGWPTTTSRSSATASTASRRSGTSSP